MLPPTSGTSLERATESILQSIDANYIAGFAFDETGLRRMKYDFAVMGFNGIAFLIECDGAPHYEESFYVSCGNRPCRAKAHLVQVHLGDAEKARIAASKGIPLLRINDQHKDILRDLIISWVWKFCDKESKDPREISMVKMLDKYGWDFDYVPPSEPTKAEAVFLAQRNNVEE